MVPQKVSFLGMGRVRRGGYIFVWFRGDHPPPHVHVFKDGKLMAKYDLENRRLMEGRINKRISKILDQLIKEGIFHEII